MRGAASSSRLVKKVAKVHSLKKKELEKTLDNNRVQRESWRSQIQKNKKVKEEKKLLKVAVTKSSKKLGQVTKFAAVPKEAVTPSIQVTGTSGVYQSHTQFRSRIPVPRIYWRAEVAKYEEARLARQLGEIEAVIVPPKEKIVPAIKAVKKSDKLGKIEAVIVLAKEEIVPAIKAVKKSDKLGKIEVVIVSPKEESVPAIKAVKNSDKLGKIEAVIVRPKRVKKLDFWRMQEEKRTARKERMRFEREKNEKKEEEERKKEQEERKKEQEKQKEEERQFMEKMEQLDKELVSLKKDLPKEIKLERKSVVKKGRKSSQRESSVLSVVRKEALKSGSGRETEPESPTGVLEERTGFGWAGSSSSGASVGFESD